MLLTFLGDVHHGGSHLQGITNVQYVSAGQAEASASVRTLEGLGLLSRTCMHSSMLGKGEPTSGYLLNLPADYRFLPMPSNVFRRDGQDAGYRKNPPADTRCFGQRISLPSHTQQFHFFASPAGGK